MRRLLFCFIFFFVFSVSYGQFKAPKFGKIDLAEISLTRYDKDTAAGALILFDDGDCSIGTKGDGNFQIVYNRHYRIKIFKKSAFDLANIKVKLFKTGFAKESMASIKASTFNVVNGKIVESKLNSDNIFEENSKNYITKKFALPQIKEGSIIEISYTINSDFLYNFRGWYFQYSYPALWSQYNTHISEYFDYRLSTKGYLAFTINKEDKSLTTLNFRDEYSSPGSGAPVRESSMVQATTNDHLLAVQDVPAFKTEPNIDCEDNYLQSIDFELASFHITGSLERQTFAESWASINTKMVNDQDFGWLLKLGGFVSDSVKMICKGKTSDLEKAAAIYSYVQRRMKWNDHYAIFAVNGLKKPYNDRTGNSAEINLLLTLMLKSAGLNATPVLFSTRDNGFILDMSPGIARFNSVLAKVDIDGKTILLDASSDLCPIGVLPPNDINGQGRAIDNAEGYWVPIVSNTKYTEGTAYYLKLNTDGSFTGTVQSKYDGYAAIDYRQQLKKVKNNDEFIKLVQENEKYKGLTINSYQVANRNDIYQPVSDSMNIKITDHVDMIGDKLLFTPLLYEALLKNEYTLEDRKYPVNYNYPVSETYVFEYTIPEGYQVESVPKPVRFKLPDNSIAVSYIIQNQDNRVIVVYSCNITKVLFLPEEYNDLKEFYNQIVKVHSEKIILKKV
ncbi:MAG: hypothetical protein Q8908_05605 [Bacteroidota bacterium]|nr:hypothetical protein [Bacteroidota bacterium]